MSEEEQFNQAFGEHTGISQRRRERINDIRQLAQIKEFSLCPIDNDVERFSDMAWLLLGRYIANNNHLKEMDLDNCNITKENMTLLFNGLVKSSLSKLDLRCNPFGVNGVRCMVGFLQNSPQLICLDIGNTNISTKGFALLIHTLHDNPLTELKVNNCNIADISALETYNLPNLQYLNLNRNNIGREGCITLSNILQNEASTLTKLHLDSTGIGDEEAKILATSLENNIKLQELSLDNNNITKIGCRAFLKLVVNISSIESTCNSNHTLVTIRWPRRTKFPRLIDIVFGYKDEMNNFKDGLRRTLIRHQLNPARAKIITYQLGSYMRKEFCSMQGIEYTSIGSLFADINPKLLPDILALIGGNHGQSELYTALIQMVPDLLSCIDRNAMIKDEMARNSSQMAELTRQLAALYDKNDLLSKMLD